MLSKNSISVNLELRRKNNELIQSILQGSSDNQIVATLLKDGIPQTLTDDSEVDITIVYNVDTSNEAYYVLNHDDSEYDITVVDNKVTIPLSDKMTAGIGDSLLIIKIKDGESAYSYSMKFVLDENKAFSPQSAISNLPTFKDIETKIKQIETDVSTDNAKINDNAGKIAHNVDDIRALEQTNNDMTPKVSKLVSDMSKAQSDITNNIDDIKSAEQKISDMNSLIDDNRNDLEDVADRVDKVEPKVSKLESDTSKNIDDIKVINTELPKKALNDLSNVDGFANAGEGQMFAKVGDKFVPIPLTVDSGKREFITPYSMKIAPNSLHLGENTTLHQNGGFLEYHTESLNKNYLLLDYENDPITGTKKPIYWERKPIEKNVKIQPISNTVMNNLSILNFRVPTFDRQVQSITFNVVNPIKNLKMGLEVNGEIVEYYPSKDAWDNDDVKGYKLNSGMQKIDFEPFFSSLKQYNIKVHLKADDPISLLGDGTLPYFAEDLNRIDKHDVLIDGDVTELTPEEMVTKLETLKLDNRLDASAVKNIPTTNPDTGDTIISKIESATDKLDYGVLKNTPTPETYAERAVKFNELTGEDRLDYNALKNTVPPRTDTEIALGLNKLTGDDRISYNSLKNVPTIGGDGVTKFVELKDTPNDYNGKGGNIVKVNSAENGLEFEVLSDYANVDLSNVDDDTMKRKAVSVGMLQNDLEDVDLQKLYDKGIDAKLADGTKQKALEAEVNRLKTDVSVSDLPIYSWRGRGVPVIDDTKPYKAYYLHAIVLRDSNGIISIPSNAPDGATLSLENNDRRNYLTVNAPVGETISGSSTSFKCDFDTLNFFVKNGSNWVHAFGGVFPNSITAMMSTIKSNLPASSLNTIDEIQAQLKDRLHTFREIQNEFNDQLHTFDEISTDMTSKGFTKHSGEVTWTNMDGSAGGKSDAVTVEQPLQAYVDPNSPSGQDIIKLRIKHGFYEHEWSSGYLAYANENIEVVGVESSGIKTGKLWFKDEVVSGGSYVYPSKTNKAITIQETDELDPNITGGTDFLVAYRVALKGIAPNDGYVKIYLKDRMSDLVINDVNGNPFMIKRKYKQGDTLGYLECINVVNAKGVKDLEMFVEDNFTTDTLVIEDRTQGISGIMVQALSSKGKTGKALLDYEVTTMQAIEFTHHYYGEDFMSIDYLVKKTQPITTGAIGEGMTMEDGFHFYNTTPMNFGVQDNHLVFTDDGTNECYFSFGKIFNAENTYALRGKQINLDVTLVDRSNGFIIQPVKWTGLPNEYTTKIITDDNPTLEPNWTFAEGRVFIPKDVTIGDHKVTSAFTVPDNAVNFGVLIYPVAKESPMTLKLKQFTASIQEPFNGWIVHSPHLIGEEHLKYSTQYFETGMNSEGSASLRFTINASPTKMPVGYRVNGKADIEVNEAWKVGSQPKGEGVFQFNRDGTATISPTIRVHRGEGAIGDQTLTFEWKKRIRNIGNPTWDESDYDQITNSVFTHVIKESDIDYEYVAQPSFKVNVKAGDLVGFWLHTDNNGGAYIQSDSANENLVAVEVDFDEITADEAEILENIKEIRFTQSAKDAGVYIEVDYDTINDRPSMTAKKG